MEPIQLMSAEPVNVPEPIEITATPQPPQLPDNVINNRVNKLQLGTPAMNKTQEELHQGFSAGSEEAIRMEAATIKDQNDSLRREQLITTIAKQQNRPLTLPEVALIRDIAAKKQNDPNSVIEEGYATAFMENLRKTSLENPGSDMARAFTELPGTTEKDMIKGKDLRSKMEFVRTQIENAEAVAKNQSTAGYIADFAKGFIPGYQSITQLDPKFIFQPGGLAPGNNIDAQAAALFNMPWDKFKTKITTDTQKMIEKNPGLAVQYLSALLNQSQSERIINNLFPVFDVVGLSDVAVLGKSAYETLRLANTARRAMRQVVSAPTGEASKAIVQEASGNIKEAAIQRAAVDGMNKIAGTGPVDDGISALQSIFGQSVRDISGAIDPALIGPVKTQRPFSQEMVNRLEERSNSIFGAIVDNVQNSMKINPLSGMAATEENFRLIGKDLVTRYPGLENSILNYVPRTDAFGSLHIDTYISRDGMSLFSSEKVARDFINTHGLGDVASVVEAQGPGGLKQVKVAGTGVKIKTPKMSEGKFPRDPGEVRLDADAPSMSGATTGPNETPKVTGFKTSKGSLYELNPDGTTTRNKSYHPEHGRKDIGPQPKSYNTFYVTLDEAQALGEFQTQGPGKKLARLPDGRWGVQYTDGPGKGKFEKRTVVKPKTSPAVGLMPVEVWSKGTKVHFGNNITELTGTPPPSSILDIDERVGASGITQAQYTTIPQKGAGFYVNISTPVDVTRPIVRSLILTTKEAKTPISWTNAFGGWLGSIRTPEDTLSVVQNQIRKVATFGPSNYVNVLRENLQEIKDLRGFSIPGTTKREKWNDWQRVMDAAYNNPDPRTGEKGRLSFKSVGDLSDTYLNNLHRLPDDQEIAAAFALKRNDEILDAFNKTREFKRLTRLGSKSVTFSALDVAKEGAKTVPYKNLEVNAIPVNPTDIPKSKVNVLRLGTNVGEEKINSAENLFRNLGKAETDKSKLIKALEAGTMRMYRLPNPLNRPFRGFGIVEDDLIEYVISSSAKETPINWGNIKVGRIPNHDYDNYVSQARMFEDKISKRMVYEGDTPIAAFNIPAMGRDVADRLDKIRAALDTGDVAAAKRVYDEGRLPQEWAEVKGWFDSGKLNTKERIRLVPKGQVINDMDKDMPRRYGDAFKDGTKEAYGNHIDDQRDPFDVFTYKNEGTKAQPLYSLTPVKHIDPLTTMNRAMSKAVNGMHLDDYKATSIEHWIQEAKDHLDVSDENLASAPAYWFYNAAERWKPGVSIETKSNLMTAQYQIKQFLGIQDQTTTWLHQFAQKMSDSLYASPAQKIALVPNHILSSDFVRDPFQAVRTFAFHAKLGLFAIPQLIVQMQTFALTYGIAGHQYAAPGAKATMFHLWARLNQSEGVLDHLDKLASKQLLPGSSNWKPGEWKEAFQLLSRSGFENVGGEHIFRDATQYYDFIGSKTEGILNAGKFFFTEGERQTRTAAFYTAFREIRDVNPVGRMTPKMEEQVLQRADLLSANMSRASASSIHKGVFSVPATFYSYQIRVAEQVLGKRLTSTERARLFATYSVLYGVPGAFGLSGLPVGDYINKWAQEGGYIAGPENNFVNSMMTEGVPATVLALATGNQYNISERYASPGGLSPISEMMKGDKTFLEIIGGAPTSILSNFLANGNGFYRMMLDGISGEGDFKFKPEDILDPLKEIAAVNYGTRLYETMNTGRWLSRNEGYLGDTSTANAIFMTVTGLSPQGSADMINQSWTRKDERAAQAQGLGTFVKEMRRGFQAQTDNNYDQALDYFKRAFHVLRVTGFPEERYTEAFAIAARGWESMIDRANWDYYLKNVPASRKAAATQAFEQYIKNKNR